MTISVIQIDAASGEALKTVTGAGAPEKVAGVGFVPVTSTLGSAFGTFKAVTRTTAGTTIITEPDPGGSLILTDLLVSSGKFSSGSVQVQFTDGTDTVSIFDIDVTDAPIVVALPFAGRWQGWKDARLEMVTVLDPDATVAAGYVKIPAGIPFAEWDALR